MNVREIQAKTLLSSVKNPDPWFGIKYTLNLYRGCGHHCIYCDSRSECYQIEDFDAIASLTTAAATKQCSLHFKITGYAL